MIRVDSLLDTRSVSLVVFDHPPGDAHRDPPRELAECHSISFVEAGSFDVHAGGELWQFTPGTIFVTAPDLEFSCEHDSECPTDRCLSVRYRAQSVEELLEAGVPALRSRLARLSARHRYLHHRLRSCAAGDELRLELIAGALFESLTGGGSSRPVRAGERVTDVMRRIDRVVELIETDYSRPLALGELAATAGMSVYHFARVFREMTGLPPHRYLTAVRLRHAARRLDEGASVTRTCYDAGFASLSHFVTAFRLRFGVAPSEARRGTHYRTLRASLAAPLWPVVNQSKNTQAR